MPNYARPDFDPEVAKSLARPERGARVLSKEKSDAEAKAHEIAVKTEVKRLDGFKCRIAVPHKCRGGLEAAHILDASLGGEMTPENLISACRWIHRQGAVSIHQKRVRVEPETPRGGRGPCAFWVKDEDGQWFMAARERLLHVLERD